MIKAERYDTTAMGNLVGREETNFDDRGRVYQTVRYAVDPATGTVGNSLTDNAWYDAAGNVIKQQPTGAKLFTKRVYDGVARQKKAYLGYDLDETAYSEVANVIGDTVLEQIETDYDAAGNSIQMTARQRYHNATGTGELGSPTSAEPKARVAYVAHYHEPLGRQIATAEYGTNGGTALLRSSTVPATSDTVLVTTTEYNSRGEAFKTIDPAGKEDRQEFDDAGRRVKLIENYADGDPATGSVDEDRTTIWTYTADGQIASLTARNGQTGDQVTRYVYGTTLSDSAVARSDLLRAEIYPDSDDVANPLGNGADGVYDRIELKYNRQGERTELKDQNGTVHAYDHDKLGRQTQDRITTLGSGVDGAVRRIATTYEVRGMRERITSYDSATVSQGNVVNEVLFDYNPFGQLVQDYQSHSGAVDTLTTPKVEYAYAAGVDNHVRPTGLTYPNGRVLSYDYGATGGTGDAASRVQAIKDGTLALAQYSYLGQGTLVEVDYTEPDLKYTLVDLAGSNDPDTGDIYSGFDRFDRIKDSRWHNYATAADVDRIKYGYDRAGNRTYRENLVADNHGGGFDELYAYDGLHRLKDFDRGDLNATKDGIATLKFAQRWSLDSTGNWAGLKEDANGDAAWDLDQSRTANRVNEITDIREIVGPAWVTPAYDRAGNMTTVPKPADPTAAFSATYDGWNRLVKLAEGANTVAEYQYDGARRRTVKKVYASGVLDETRHLYYSEPDKWQVLEERVAAGTDAERQFVWGLRYVDDLVCRDRDVNGDGTLDERLYAMQDANWNVATLADSATVAERLKYDPYGHSTVLDGDFVDDVNAISDYDWEYRFTSREHDTDTGLYNFRARYHHSALGSFVGRDPLKYVDGLHLYLLARGNPARFVDPFGTCAEYLNCCMRARDAYACTAYAVCRTTPNNCVSNCTRDCLLARYTCGDGIATVTADHAVCFAECTGRCAIETVRECPLPRLPIPELPRPRIPRIWPPRAWY